MAATIHPLAGWSWTVQGPVHAQPFYYHPAGASYGLIIVATDNATVVALNSQTGQTVWPRSLGTLVPSRPKPCGNYGAWPDVGTLSSMTGARVVCVVAASFLGDGTPAATTTNGSSNPIVWMIGSEGDNQVHGFRGDNGQALFAPSGNTQVPNARRYVTPLVAEGYLFIDAYLRLRPLAAFPQADATGRPPCEPWSQPPSVSASPLPAEWTLPAPSRTRT